MYKIVFSGIFWQANRTLGTYTKILSTGKISEVLRLLENDFSQVSIISVRRVN